MSTSTELILEQLKAIVLERIRLRNRRVNKELLDAKTREFEQVLEGSLELMHKYHLLTSCECIGPVTAQAILVFLPELGTLPKKKLIKLAGLNPEAEKGHYRTKLRNALFTALRLNKANLLVINTHYYVANSRPAPAFEDDLEITSKDLRKIAGIVLTILNSMIKEDLTYEQWLTARGLA